MSKKNVPLLFGEVLFDVFEDKAAILGGAPFNVAWHLQGFGLQPLFVSRIGGDKNGSEVMRRVKEWGMSFAGIQKDDRYPTGIVSVTTKKGEPQFNIRSDQAYDFINAIDVEKIIANTAYKLIYHGTLALRNDVSHRALNKIIQKTGTKIFLDINLRKPWWSDKLILKMITEAQWLKCNSDELDLIAQVMQIDAKDIHGLAYKICKKFDLEFVIVTLGDKGAFIIDKDDQISKTRPSRILNLVDTVGAGDGFSAVAILGILKNWNKQTILKRSAEFASKICQTRGAILNDEKYYKRILNEWKVNDEE